MYCYWPFNGLITAYPCESPWNLAHSASIRFAGLYLCILFQYLLDSSLPVVNVISLIQLLKKVLLKIIDLVWYRIFHLVYSCIGLVWCCRQYNSHQRCPSSNPWYLQMCYLTWKTYSADVIKLKTLRWRGCSKLTVWWWVQCNYKGLYKRERVRIKVENRARGWSDLRKWPWTPKCKWLGEVERDFFQKELWFDTLISGLGPPRL